MDLFRFNKINRSNQSFEIKDENNGYEAKGVRQKAWGSGLGVSFSFSSEVITESDSKGLFPLLGKSFDDILSLGSEISKGQSEKTLPSQSRKAIKAKKNALPDVKDHTQKQSGFGGFFNWF
jgi:hypothetical protein